MKAIVFDLDGTLIDSAPDIHLASCKVLDLRGISHISLDTARGFIGHGAEVFVARLMSAVGLPAAETPKVLHDFLQAYETAVHLTQPYPGVLQALTALGDAGWTIGLCTNKPLVPTRAVLAHVGLNGVFGAVIGGDSLPQRKPDAAPLWACLRVLGAERALFVGDSEVDAQTALNAALPFALFTEGYRKVPIDQLPHLFAFSDFAALPELAERWSADQARTR